MLLRAIAEERIRHVRVGIQAVFFYGFKDYNNGIS